MNIVLCTKKDIFGAVILNLLLPTLQHHRVKVLLSDKIRDEETRVPELIQERFLEHDLPVDTLFPLLDGSRQSGELLTFTGATRKYGVSIETIEDVNDAAAERMFKEWQTDLIVSIRFSLLFQSNILRIPRHGAFNVHPGALPAYAGLWSPFWAILHGEKELGCAVHAIDEGIDTGPLYSHSTLPFQAERSVFAHIGDLYMTGLASVLMLVQELERGATPTLTPQDPARRGYYSLPGAEELAQFTRLGVAPVAYDRYQELLGRFVPKSVERRAVTEQTASR